MESYQINDSQLSDAINAARLMSQLSGTSNNSNNCPQSTQLNGDEIARIINEKQSSLSHEESFSNLSNILFSSAGLNISRSSNKLKQPVLRRRSNKLSLTHKYEMETDRNMDKLNISNQDMSNTTIIAGLMDAENCTSFQSLESECVLSEKAIDSQENVLYLKKKTNSKKEKICKQTDETESDSLPMLERQDYLHNSPDIKDFECCETNNTNDNINYLKLIVNENFVSSDYRALDRTENGKVVRKLWIKAQKPLPLLIRWNLNDKIASKNVLKIKLCHWSLLHPPKEAFNMRTFDVKKCRYHIENETRPPHESFLYFCKGQKGIHWKVISNGNEGNYIKAVIPEDVNNVELEIMLTCKHMCYSIKDAKLPICLAAMLEDCNGNQLVSDFIEDVKIVAYPSRDHKNFVEKRNTTQKGNIFGVMLNVCNKKSQSDNMTKISRKRIADDFSEIMDTQEYKQEITKKKSDYQARLMLGKAPGNEYEDDLECIVDVVDENKQNCVKRARESAQPVYWIPVYGESDALKMFNMAASFAKRDRYESTKRYHSSSNPLAFQSQIIESDIIDKWLRTMCLEHYSSTFNRCGIFLMSDLIEKYENIREIFEKMNIPPEDCDKLHRVFINYYNVTKCSLLTEYQKNRPT